MDHVNAERFRNVDQAMSERDHQVHEPVRIPREFGRKPAGREGRVAPQDRCALHRQGVPEPAAKLLGREVTGASLQPGSFTMSGPSSPSVVEPNAVQTPASGCRANCRIAFSMKPGRR